MMAPDASWRCRAVQILKQLKLRPKRTIRVVLWMNEENGLMGARSYMNDHKSEVANHFAAIEADAGAGRPMGFVAAGKPEILTLLQPLADNSTNPGRGRDATGRRRGSGH